MLVGVIADTHGLLRPEALEALRGVEHILHAGDVGEMGILERLREIAPVTAVRGNVDTEGACAALPLTEMLEMGGCFVYMVHAREWLDIVPTAAGVGLVVCGHSHVAGVEEQDGVMYLNPGSAGPRRFKLAVTVARVRIEGGVVAVEIVELE